jgi:hypothetical protein
MTLDELNDEIDRLELLCNEKRIESENLSYEVEEIENELWDLYKERAKLEDEK